MSLDEHKLDRLFQQKLADHEEAVPNLWSRMEAKLDNPAPAERALTTDGGDERRWLWWPRLAAAASLVAVFGLGYMAVRNNVSSEMAVNAPATTAPATTPANSAPATATAPAKVAEQTSAEAAEPAALATAEAPKTETVAPASVTKKAAGPQLAQTTRAKAVKIRGEEPAEQVAEPVTPSLAAAEPAAKPAVENASQAPTPTASAFKESTMDDEEMVEPVLVEIRTGDGQLIKGRKANLLRRVRTAKDQAIQTDGERINSGQMLGKFATLKTRSK